MIECCRIRNNGDEFKVKTKSSTKYNIGDEFIEKIICKKCKCLLVRLYRFDKSGNSLGSEIFRGKKAKQLLDQTYIISKRYKEKLVDNRWYLPYSDDGIIKKCYSYLSNLKIGLIDPDPYQVL